MSCSLSSKSNTSKLLTIPLGGHRLGDDDITELDMPPIQCLGGTADRCCLRRRYPEDVPNHAQMRISTPVAKKSKRRQLRPEGSRSQAQPGDPDRADRDRRAVRRRAGALHRAVNGRQGAVRRGEVDPGDVEQLITKDGGTEPKAVLSFYEDFLCPDCGGFEKGFGPTISKLIDTRRRGRRLLHGRHPGLPGDDTTRHAPANAAYCVADETEPTGAFRRFHAALFAQQPAEGAPAPDDAALIEPARQAGAADCARLHQQRPIRGDGEGLAAATNVTAHPDRPDQRRGIRVRALPTRWSPRSRRSSATCRVWTPAAPAPAAP